MKFFAKKILKEYFKKTRVILKNYNTKNVLELKAINDRKCISHKFLSISEIDNIKKALSTSFRLLANQKQSKKIEKKKKRKKNRKKA